MNSRAAGWLAWSLFGIYVLTVAATLGLVAFGHGSGDDTLVVLTSGYALVGALVATREPGNAVGWLLLVIAVAYGLPTLAEAYVRGGGRSGEVAAAWFASWSWSVWILVAGVFLPLLFPTGRLVSPRWRVAVWIGGAALVLSVIGAGLDDRMIEVEPREPIPNPFGVGGPASGVVTAAAGVGTVLTMIGFVLGAVSLVVRMRRSRGRERQQLKLFAYVVGAFVLTGLLVLALALVSVVPGAPRWLDAAGGVGFAVALLLALVGLPVAIGVAILRHRLYDIDVVINRTLVYGALTVILAVAYLASVLVLRLLLSPLTGQSDLAVAGSTLAVAALFRPARRRIQAAVDRRFYRQRYDAARTIDAFSSRLRDELDLETLTAELRGVAQETLQPEHVFLWLRHSP
jgi:hypothetical protein